MYQQCGFLPLLTLVVDAAFTPPVLVQEESLRTLQLWRFSCLEGIWKGELVDLGTGNVITDVFHYLPSLPESLDGLQIVLEAANFPREYAIYLFSEII